MSFLTICSPTVLAFLVTSQFYSPSLTNMILQTLVFLLTAHLPCLLTGRMSYVDIAWPWGLLTIGLLPIISPPPVSSARTYLVMAAYLLAGFRMALGKLVMGTLPSPNITRVILPRRRYSVSQWKVHGGVSQIQIPEN